MSADMNRPMEEAATVKHRLLSGQFVGQQILQFCYHRVNLSLMSADTSFSSQELQFAAPPSPASDAVEPGMFVILVPAYRGCPGILAV